MTKISIKKSKSTPPPKRKRGERAGLSRETIISKSIELMDKSPSLTIQQIANGLGVTPGTIYAQFPRGLSQILPELVRTVLRGVARPFQPNENWEAYLRDLFVALLSTFHEHRNLAVFVARELSVDYYINPLLVERILFALNMAGAPTKERARTLELVMANLIGFITIDCTSLGSQSSAQWTESLSEVIEGLPAGEHPQIKSIKSQLIEIAAERATQIDALKPSSVRAHRFADHLIAGLKALYSIGSPQ